MTRIFKEVAPWIPEPTSTRFIPYEHHAFWKLKTGRTVRLIVRRRNGWTKVLWALDGYEFFKTKRTFCNPLTEDEAKEILLTGNHGIREMYREMSDEGSDYRSQLLSIGTIYAARFPSIPSTEPNRQSLWF